MSITFGFINGTSGHRIGITLGDSPERLVRIMDNMRDAEIAESLRELADAYDPPAVRFPDPDWISVKPASWGRAELTIHGKSVMLVGKPDVDLPAVAAAVAPNLAARLFRIEDDMPDVEGQDPIPLAQARAKPPVHGALAAAAEWQCVASALGLAVAMLESNSPEVIRAAQALAVSKVHELRS